MISPPQFFDFHTTKLEHNIILPSAVVSILLHRDSGLLAVVCDDMLVRLVDIETRKIVRELGGFRGRVLDIVWFLDWNSPHLVSYILLGFFSRLPVVSRDLNRLRNPDI